MQSKGPMESAESMDSMESVDSMESMHWGGVDELGGDRPCRFKTDK